MVLQMAHRAVSTWPVRFHLIPALNCLCLLHPPVFPFLPPPGRLINDTGVTCSFACSAAESVQQLEGYGHEALKTELERLGLKCGGSLQVRQPRSERFFVYSMHFPHSVGS